MIEVDLPDGSIAEFPDGTDHAVIKSALSKHFSASPTTQAPPQGSHYDPTEDMSAGEKLLAGYGKAGSDLYLGAKQLLLAGAGPTGTPSDAKVQQMRDALTAQADENKKTDTALLNTGWGKAGHIAGSVVDSIPAMLVPGANTIAGSGLTGAVLGGLQPTGAEDSRLQNMAVGGAMGAAIPAVIQGGGKLINAAGNVVSNFTDKGASRLAAQKLQQLAGGEANLGRAAGYTPAIEGFQPTLAEASLNPGIASTELARSSDPVFKTALRAQQDANKLKMIDLLNTMRGEDKGLQSAIIGRAQDTQHLYKAATANPVHIDDELQAILDTPAGKQALSFAKEASANMGAGDIIKNGEITGSGISVLKKSLDEAASVNPQTSAEKAAANGFKAVRGRLNDWLTNKLPDYKAADALFAEKSIPINQMEIADSLYNKLVPALSESGIGNAAGTKIRANAYAEALRKAEDSVKSITGRNVALSDVMSPEQMSILQGIQSDLARSAQADAQAASKGSTTAQNLFINQLTDSIAHKLPYGSAIMDAGKAVMSKSKVNQKLAEMLLDPQAYAQGAALYRPASQLPNQLSYGASPLVNALMSNNR